MACQYSFNCSYNWYFQRLGKSKKAQIFFNNTKILEDSFAYHATGWQILKGRIIAVIVILILGAGSTLHTGFSFISFLIIFFFIALYN